MKSFTAQVQMNVLLVLKLFTKVDRTAIATTEKGKLDLPIFRHIRV